jgi:hypothetical protein
VVAACLPLLCLQRVDPWSRTWLFILPLYFGLGAAGLVLATSRLPVPRALRGAAFVPLVALVLCATLALGTLRGREVWRSIESGAAVDGEARQEKITQQSLPLGLPPGQDRFESEPGADRAECVEHGRDGEEAECRDQDERGPGAEARRGAQPGRQGEEEQER